MAKIVAKIKRSQKPAFALNIVVVKWAVFTIDLTDFSFMKMHLFVVQCFQNKKLPNPRRTCGSNLIGKSVKQNVDVSSNPKSKLENRTVLVM